MSPEPIRLTRRELYEAVWADPLQVVAARYGISDVGLGKVCKRLKIPRPGRGYWRRKRTGHPTHRPPLPPIRGADAGDVVVKFRPRRYGSTSAEPEGPVADQRRFEARPDNRIEVPEQVSRYHPVIREARRMARTSSLRFGSWGGCHPTISSAFDVDRTSLPRALRILHALIRALEQRGFQVYLTKEEKPRMVVRTGQVEVQVMIKEAYRRVEVPPTAEEAARARRHDSYEARTRWRWEATGQLSLRILELFAEGTRKTWADGSRQRLESLLNSFVVGLVAAAEARREWERERDEWNRRWEEKRRAEEEQRIRAEEEQRRRAELLSMAASWREAQYVRRFLRAVRAGAEASPHVAQGGVLQTWLAWAEDIVRRRDPILAGVGPLAELVGPSPAPAEGQSP